MKKINNKGFMMLETLVVSVFIVTILTYLYIQFVNLKSSYSVSFKYDTVENLYKMQEIDEFINNNIGYSKFYSGNDIEVYNNKCNLSYFAGVSTDCDQLLDKLGVKYVILVTPYTQDSEISTTTYSKELLKYYKKIKQKYSENHMMLAQFEDDTFASILVNEGTTVIGNYKCIKATELHSNYGSIGTKGTLAPGNAFDCDVNGDGTYDSDTERFYYVAELMENTNYAVLIYYNNYSQAAKYNDSNVNYSGPVSVTTLPTTAEWSNVNLYEFINKSMSYTGSDLTNNQSMYMNYDLSPTVKRAITSAKVNTAGTGMEFNTAVNDGTSHALPTAFEGYTGKSARLLRIEELIEACGDKNITAGTNSTASTNYFSNCTYFVENVETINTKMYWLENPVYSSSTSIYYVGPNNKVYNTGSASTAYGVRPVIEVRKSDIKY